MKMTNSKKAFKEALRYLPGGVNSPVRAFQAVGGTPVFMAKGSGPRITDIDGNTYIDYVMSWGAMILGHVHPDVVAAVKKAAESGSSFGACTRQETLLAKVIAQAVPSMEKVRLVSSGTEATMNAIRLARGFTGRAKIIKFDGCYHGHYDGLLVKAGSGAATLGVPGSAGVPEGLSRDTIVCPYNNIVTFRQVMERHGRDVAAVIVEPVAANMGVVVPHEDFLSELRRITARYGVLLIFDEVITGFRFHFGGAQTLWKIKPDLTCLGKIIGGGLPMGAYGGRRDIMQRVAPLGDVYQAGTLSGNPVAVAAGMATLKVLKQQDYKLLERRTTMLCQGLQGSFQAQGISTTINQCGSLFTVFFSKDPVTDFTSAKKADAKRYAKYFWSMLRRGVYLPPSQFEAQFVSFAHKEVDLRKTCKVC